MPRSTHYAMALLVTLVATACAASSQVPRANSPPASRAPTMALPTKVRTAASVSPVADRRVVAEQAWAPFARVADVTLRLPSSRVEFVGLHQSNHEGAHELSVLPGAPRSRTLESRGRLTSARTAGDVVSDPNVEIRAPVTGRVKRAGTYVLYCEHSDDYAVIAPDVRPSWEVKVLHIDGVGVHPGDRVVAGETVLAPRPTKLPFESDTDEFSATPAWPHVHIEVVDPAIPNRPSPGSGC